MNQKVSLKTAKMLGDHLRVDWNSVSLHEFRRGLEVEQEHWKTIRSSWLQVARIALDHLAEIPDYYTRLDAMEAQAKRGL
ncbi:MAG: DUF5661 family protein [Planctomycetota bacterium]|jgi:hypothetical protein